MKLVVALVGCAVVVAAASADTVLYQTGFESPTFVAGDLIGQDNWTGDTAGAATIQSAVVHSGDQAVMIDSSPLYGTNWWWRNGAAYNPVASGTPIVTVETYMLLSDTPGDESDSWGVDVYDSTVARVGMWYVDYLGDLYAWDGVAQGVVDTGANITRGVWYQFTAEFNYAAGTYVMLVDGFQVGGAVPMDSTLDFSDADFRCAGPWYDQAYFDDFSVIATPEPAALLLLGLAGLMIRRR